MRLTYFLCAVATVFAASGCAGLAEWFSSPNPVTGTVPSEDAQDAINALFRGDWVTVFLKAGALVAAGVGSVVVGKKVVTRVRRPKVVK